LNIKGMARNRKLALSVADAGMGEVLRQLAYKAERLVEVSRWYASSKTCSDCGHVNRELTVSDRTWLCAGCGVLHERDWNAAINILQEGLRVSRRVKGCPGSGPEGTPRRGQGTWTACKTSASLRQC
jgi:putative transposase